MNTQYWIIKHAEDSPTHGGHRYWTGFDILGFTGNILKAVRFADTRSANAVAGGTLKGVETEVLSFNIGVDRAGNT